VAWWIAEADARVEPHRRASLFGQVSARGPLWRASDGFAWGTEVRATVGARVAAITERLALVVTSDLQWRNGTSEPDPFSGGRLASANAGGWQGTMSPAAVVELGAGVSASAGARLPLWSDVVGNQLVPQAGGFVAVSYTPRLAPRRSATPYRPPPGQITVVDYWATWCVPCVEISRQLEVAAPRWLDVRIVRIDASSWPSADAPALPPGADGLPTIEVFDETGARLALLVGPDALHAVERIDALRARRPLTTREAREVP
jgi:thiol-disulfide isomerase/thioredoxin